jgi:hypothetical protein
MIPYRSRFNTLVRAYTLVVHLFQVDTWRIG